MVSEPRVCRVLQDYCDGSLQSASGHRRCMYDIVALAPYHWTKLLLLEQAADVDGCDARSRIWTCTLPHHPKSYAMMAPWRRVQSPHGASFRCAVPLDRCIDIPRCSPGEVVAGRRSLGMIVSGLAPVSAVGQESLHLLRGAVDGGESCAVGRHSGAHPATRLYSSDTKRWTRTRPAEVLGLLVVLGRRGIAAIKVSSCTGLRNAGMCFCGAQLVTQ